MIIVFLYVNKIILLLLYIIKFLLVDSCIILFGNLYVNCNTVYSYYTLTIPVYLILLSGAQS